MKALVLAGGYATRLYPLTRDKPKPLLTIAGKPIVEHILEEVAAIEDVDSVFIVTNNRFHEHFVTWLESFRFSKKVVLVNDGTISNEDRLGAVGDIQFVVDKHQLDDDLLVIAGDNLFGFSLQNFVGFAKDKSTSIVAFRNLGDLDKVRNRFGVGILEGSRVINFEEKPASPKSTLASTACYLFKKDDLVLIKDLVRAGKADNPGDLLRFVAQESEVHGFVFQEHWFDIGTPASLEEAEEFYSNLQ